MCVTYVVTYKNLIFKIFIFEPFLYVKVYLKALILFKKGA